MANLLEFRFFVYYSWVLLAIIDNSDTFDEFSKNFYSFKMEVEYWRCLRISILRKLFEVFL